MSEIEKPESLNTVWADQGSKIRPEDNKIQFGWMGGEVPPSQYFNWLDNRQDQALAHINQHGIAVWDAFTTYVVGKSYVQGSNGEIYKAIQTSAGQNPTNPASQYWQKAFIGFDDPTGAKAYVGYQTMSSSFTAVVNSRYYLLSPLTITLPTTGSAGDVITLTKRNSVTAIVRVSTGNIITSIGSDTSVSYDLNDEINFVYNGTNWEV